MAKLNDIRNLLKGRKETNAAALVLSATDDVSQTELMVVENEIKKLTQIRKHYNKIVPETMKERLGNMHYFMETKQQLSDSIRFIQSTLSLELPSTTGNSK